MPRPKQNRLDPIREIIRGSKIRTQEDIAAALQLRGFASGQATVSRDMVELGVNKIENGTYVLESDMDICYLAPFVTRIEHNGTVVVLNVRGCASQAVAAAIEHASIPGAICAMFGPEKVMVACHADMDAIRISGILGRLVS